MSITLPTNIPSGDRRPVLVTGLAAQPPATLPQLFRRAARIIARNGLYQGDYFPDALGRDHMNVPYAERPLSIVAALRCATTGDPRTNSLLSDEAIAVLALRLEVDGEGPGFGDIFSLEEHVDGWGDVSGRTTDSAVAVLEAAADASEVAA